MKIDHKKYNTQPDQLCWNCKRCTNPDNLSCSWSSDGIPVEGWTAAPGRTYYSEKSPVTGRRVCIGVSYAITECPLFIQDKPFSTYGEALRYIADKLDLNLSTVQHNAIKYIKRFEKKFSKKIPDWVKEHHKEC